MPLQATSGAASYDAFGGGVAAVPNYIEEVFSTYLYTGNGSTQTITNNLDLSGKGGLTWIKCRNSSTPIHIWVDSARGNTKVIYSNANSDQYSEAGLTTLNTSGFSVGQVSTSVLNINASGQNYASWSFRKQPKFFDVLTYTGTGSPRTISHNLGSVPGCIIVKRTDNTGSWRVYHRGMTSAAYMVELNTSSGEALDNASWNSTAPTSTVFTVGSDAFVNASGGTYVAYIFAHNAAGFGLLGTDNVISCGSFTTNGSGVASVNLGYEPQWVVAKAIAGGTGDWFMQDNMRGFTASPTVYTANPLLRANTSDSEATYGGPTLQANSTGFTTASATYDPSVTYIYIAIRRGPMKVPTSGTSVFDPEAYTGTSATRTITSGFPVDLSISKVRDQTYPGGWFDRLRGALQVIRSSSTDAEATSTGSLTGFDSNTGVILGTDPSGRINTSPNTYVMWNFQRAPSFFDEVCYTGTGNNNTSITHNLAVVPELIIVKDRSAAIDWGVYHQAIGQAYAIFFNQSSATVYVGDFWGTTAFTSTTFRVGNYSALNTNTENYVAYLFATCAGVSKVGSYTGTGTTLQIDCGFTGGARFVLIKRTDDTGAWYVWDSARGIVAGNDPYLLLNSTAAEVTSTDYVDTYSAGFEISSTAPAAINASGGTFIFLAIA